MSAEEALPSGITGTGTGGDSLTVDLNVQFNRADMVWIGVSGILVFIMIIPGVGLLYSGLARKKHALSLIWAAIMATSLVAFQWFFWGYSLAFAHDGSEFLGTLSNFALKDVLGAPSAATTVPDILFCFYQGMFAAITSALMLGGACERARLGPMMVFLFIWMTVVYCPVAYWTWNPNGWLATLGALDFAGGGPVHQTSGISALAYALILGKRNDPVTVKGVPKYKPHSVTYLVLGTVFLWFGWFGFNGGSTGNSTIRSYYACVNTHLAASCAALTWMFIDYFRSNRKYTTVGLCCGAISGLVGITPAAGFVPVYFAVPIGVITATCCNFAVDIKSLIGIDDGMDVFAIHCVGGFTGSVLTGLFAADYIAATDGSTFIDGGWLNGHYVQLGYQLAACCATNLWGFVVTSIILLAMDRVPFLKLRLKPEEEFSGTDGAQIGEWTTQDEDEQIYIPQPVRSVKSHTSKSAATPAEEEKAESAHKPESQ
ncbi:ammonium permease MEP2 [Ascoidea rubescens DSM 1968]|uniref:Ammonium transporter n=1 Tax=Ascoidea rubescens DSM 1968 TaxID=1344418 RepID=A0A1D2VNV4_9ASCO|nr:ammonium permease [Ascoidea rubescens DSM 1968]ODV63235.1 ammonium permease [Ascoidea rubescens DSM 1968]